MLTRTKTWKILNASMAVKSRGLSTNLVLNSNSGLHAEPSKLLAISAPFKCSLNSSCNLYLNFSCN